MYSKLIKQDQQALLEINKAMSPQERLMAFYYHSRLMSKLALSVPKRRKSAKTSHRAHP